MAWEKYQSLCLVERQRLIGEVGGNAKTFEFGHKKMGKETPGIISNGVFWKP